MQCFCSWVYSWLTEIWNFCNLQWSFWYGVYNCPLLNSCINHELFAFYTALLSMDTYPFFLNLCMNHDVTLFINFTIDHQWNTKCNYWYIMSLWCIIPFYTYTSDNSFSELSRTKLSKLWVITISESIANSDPQP